MPRSALLMVAAAAIALATSSAFAADEVTLVVPADSGMVLAKSATDGSSSAEFSGHAWISGKLVARWVDGYEQGPAHVTEYTLVPDAGSMRRLPFFSPYTLESIDVDHGGQALRQIANGAPAARFFTMKVDALQVSGSFLIGKYRTGVECDAPWASATVVRAKATSPPGKIEEADGGGC